MARKRNALGLRRVANLLFLFLFFPFLAEELLVPLALVLRDGGCPLFFPFLHRSSGAAESWSRVLIYRGSELHGLQFGT